MIRILTSPNARQRIWEAFEGLFIAKYGEWRMNIPPHVHTQMAEFEKGWWAKVKKEFYFLSPAQLDRLWALIGENSARWAEVCLSSATDSQCQPDHQA